MKWFFVAQQEEIEKNKTIKSTLSRNSTACLQHKYNDESCEPTFNTEENESDGIYSTPDVCIFDFSRSNNELFLHRYEDEVERQLALLLTLSSLQARQIRH